MSEAEANRLRGAANREACILQKTRSEYNKKFAKFKAWASTSHPELMIDGEIDLSAVPMDIWDDCLLHGRET